MIDYASRQRTPRKHVIGITVVVVLHGLLFWAINSGLARKFVKVIKGPVEAVLLEETKPDIPPPPPPPQGASAPPPQRGNGRVVTPPGARGLCRPAGAGAVPGVLPAAAVGRWPPVPSNTRNSSVFCPSGPSNTGRRNSSTRNWPLEKLRP